MGEEPPPKPRGSSYQVELFEIPSPRANWDAVDPGRQRLYASFVEGLSALGSGIEVSRVPTL